MPITSVQYNENYIACPFLVFPAAGLFNSLAHLPVVAEDPGGKWPIRADRWLS